MIPAAGGPAQTLCAETGLGLGGSWNRNGVILFASDQGPLRRVDASGGMCAPVGQAVPGTAPQLPLFLPDGNHFFYVDSKQGDESSSGVYLAALDNPAPRKILADFSSVVYAPAGKGPTAHLLFMRDTTLMAQPFDEAELAAVGDPFPVASQASTTLSPPQVAASVANGILAFVAGRPTVAQLTWFDRSGKELGKAAQPADEINVALSPDGNAVVVGRLEANGQRALWLHDIARNSETRFVPREAQPSLAPVWFPDGRRVLFGMNGPAGQGLYRKDVNGGNQADLVLSTADNTAIVPSTFSHDGRFLVYTVNDPKTRADIWYVPWDDKPDWGKAVKFLATDAIESQGQLSPDGKWIAYFSNETGRGEVYIRPFPSGAGLWKVSVDGGVEPRWSPDGKQLYFLVPPTDASLQRPLSTAAVESDARGGLRIGAPQKLFDVRVRLFVQQINIFAYSPHPDGRLLVNVLEAGEPAIDVITNWQKFIADKAQAAAR